LGESFVFKSCALLDIVDDAGACNGCSGHGTCSTDGHCLCISSSTDGFFYGLHCEFENECEQDLHCGTHGKCIDVGDTSGPAKQCFCEAGTFGAVFKAKSGFQRRVCNAASKLKIDTASLDTFGKEYKRTETAGPFSLFWSIRGDSIEVAMVGNTSSWVAVGWRSVDTTPQPWEAPKPAPAGRKSTCSAVPEMHVVRPVDLGPGQAAIGANATAEGPNPGAIGDKLLKTVPTGTCAGAFVAPHAAFLMTNQDIVMGMARPVAGKQYFRVVDMFTPSRSKPRPDYMFCRLGVCGTDDISDAVGQLLSSATFSPGFFLLCRTCLWQLFRYARDWIVLPHF
jgi:hypothetical protein